MGRLEACPKSVIQVAGMKAMLIRRFGGPEVFERSEVPMPLVKPGQALIRVAGSSVNPVDCRIRSGQMPSIAPELPAVLHGDVAGTVEAVGDGVTRFQPGDEVYGCAGGVRGHSGALAEYMVTDADLLARKPVTLTLLDAAALPLVYLTAWEALMERAAVQPGQRVLVHAGTGGVGHLGIQVAKQAGAFVATTVSTDEKAALARQLGADVVIPYRKQPVAEYVAQLTGGEGFDVVFDTVGGDNLTGCFQAVKTRGMVVSIAARSAQDLTPLHNKGATLHLEFVLLPLLTGAGRARHGEILTALARRIDQGELQPLFDPEVFAFRDVGAAHRKLQDHRVCGKIRLRTEMGQ